ncbi:hypothetical protein Pla22_35610 [Rubripirellula amarantea]|uniref:Uncharacterized protein n=1 Tax=Rubripirellula amarantea TaxID=2527999 RepID=A0A5C5WJ86_9BACT|nr:hypothetical protein Pla22_35610 [Rubripirellula amarantea]
MPGLVVSSTASVSQCGPYVLQRPTDIDLHNARNDLHVRLNAPVLCNQPTFSLIFGIRFLLRQDLSHNS